MGPFKFMGSVLASTASAVTTTLGAVEKVAMVADLWADTAHKASELTSTQMLDELNYEVHQQRIALEAKLKALQKEVQ